MKSGDLSTHYLPGAGALWFRLKAGKIDEKCWGGGQARSSLALQHQKERGSLCPAARLLLY